MRCEQGTGGGCLRGEDKVKVKLENPQTSDTAHGCP